ncbi:MAG TPA: helix-turn-helix transcriptional regulator [Streptosporangiaceae bacterium]|nr:helix-turn-helix transcriptional regulator [Streptosporangiaceae bacterium]
MGTKFSDYLAESKASDTAQDKALREAFAASIVLGLQFRDARVRQGLTQKDLSARSGVPQADISRIERGAGNPTETTLHRLAFVLDQRLELVAKQTPGVTAALSASG